MNELGDRLSTSWPEFGRRNVLAAAAGIAPALLCKDVLAAPSPAAPGAPADFNRLEALVKMRGSTDGRTGFAWIKGTRFARVGEAMEPLCGVLNCTLVRYRPLTADSWDLRVYEMSFYTNPATGLYQPTLTMPFTGKTVQVPLYRTGPGRHVVKTGNREEMSWSRRNTTSAAAAAALAPDGKIVYQVELSQPTILGDHVWLTTEATTHLEPYNEHAKPWFYKELITNQASMDDLANPQLTSVDATASYTLVMDFRPWMQMDGIEGQTIDHAIGGRVWKLEDLPEEIAWHLRRYQPDVASDPFKWLGP